MKRKIPHHERISAVNMILNPSNGNSTPSTSPPSKLSESSTPDNSELDLKRFRSSSSSSISASSSSMFLPQYTPRYIYVPVSPIHSPGSPPMLAAAAGVSGKYQSTSPTTSSSQVETPILSPVLPSSKLTTDLGKLNGNKVVEKSVEANDVEAAPQKPAVSKSDAKETKSVKKSEGGAVDRKAKVPLKGRTSTSNKTSDHRHLSRKSLLPVIDAAKIVERFSNLYKDVKWDNEKSTKTVALHYPGMNEPTEIFPCVKLAKLNSQEYDPILDLRQTVQIIVENCIPSQRSQTYFGTAKKGPLRDVIRACNRFRGSTLYTADDANIGPELIEAVKTLNGCMEKFKREHPEFETESMVESPAADFKLISHILEQAYARSVSPDSDRLNSYKGFSNNVYGEVKHTLVDELIRNAGIKPHHVFLDMGSGIGNVVLQVAGQCLCDSYGIEIMEIPSLLAQRQKVEFLSRMRYYSKPCGKIRLKQGDFLDDDEISEVLKRVDVIFVNNYAFNADLNQRILHKFLDLKEHTKIISLRSFISADRRITYRNMNAIESILTVKEYYFSKDSVSWMNESGKYFIHTVDRASLKYALK